MYQRVRETYCLRADTGDGGTRILREARAQITIYWIPQTKRHITYSIIYFSVNYQQFQLHGLHGFE